MTRPDLKPSLDPDVFDSYYWYLSELKSFAKELKVNTSGGKFELHDRISDYLRTGKKAVLVKKKPSSNFDWTNSSLTLQTKITDNYKNTENVRKFFRHHIGESFKFSIDFMNFMKVNIGQTLQDAIDYYNDRQKALKNEYKQKIEPHNQYNQYLRDFLLENPKLTKKDATACWLQVIEIPRPKSKGRNIRYSKEDLQFLR